MAQDISIKRISMEALKPADYNPRKISGSDYEKLKNSISEFGYVDLIILNERTGNIVGGHQRYKVLEELGYEEIDVACVDLDEVQEKALNIALNKISGDWDVEKLKDMLSGINVEGMDIQLSGFDLSEIDELMEQRSQEFSNSEIDLDDYDDESFDYCCPECSFKFNE